MGARRGRAGGEAFEVDGTMAAVTVLRLTTVDVGRIDEELRAVAARQAFPYAPVVVDVGELGEARARELPLHDLAERIRAHKLVPVGAANLPPSAVWNAAAAGMAVVELAAVGATAVETAAVEQAPVETAPVEPASVETAPVEPAPVANNGVAQATTVTVRQPVRAGQVVYAERADLVVLAPVNAGAQVMADGHIHVYGVLRGRALAGARGNGDASVFCQSLEAELVSIAGRHLVADDIPREHRGARVQLYLENGQIRIRPL